MSVALQSVQSAVYCIKGVLNVETADIPQATLERKDRRGVTEPIA